MQQIMGTWGVTRIGLEQLAMIDAVLSYRMLMFGGGLLLLAAVLMGMQRRAYISRDNEMFKDELISYLSRIANALERSSAPNGGESAAEVLRRLVNGRANGKVREMPKYHSK